MPDQAQLAKAFATIKKMATTAAKTEKEQILREGGSDYLTTLLDLAYNKFKTYRIQQIEMPAKYNAVQPDTLFEFVTICHRLASHTIGSIQAKAVVREFLAKNTEEGAEIYRSVLLRDLRGGFDEKTVNKVFPGLIPTFDVQLAAKVEEWDNIPFPTLVEEKLDGVRTLAVYNGTDVKFFSREGREFDECGVIAEQIKLLATGLPFVLDGEFIATKYNPDNKTCRKYQTGNWPFNYGLALVKTDNKTASEVKEHLGYFVWDVLDYEYFMSAGKRGLCDPLTLRKCTLASLFARHSLTFPNLFELDNFVCSDKAEVMSLFRRMRDAGKEGVMVKNLSAKYDFKRSSAVLKLKEFFNVDLRILSADPGTGKYANKLGALVVGDDEGKISSKVGSGFDDEERSVLWLDWLNGNLLGKIVEVSAQEVTKDGSLRFPTFVGLRFDKTTTNTEGMV